MPGDRFTTLGDLAGHIDELQEEMGEDTRVRANADGIQMGNVCVKVQEIDGEETVVVC